ncbi:hypothetical protein [Evansella tamaricis]|uniref:Uncharacterized protein n=1 Tax=Evansella tamaricis TaxID=2069301 RepID=A0ABS6JK96_9BACI|nr:hypothetical protein [Evansella tamaricis]MBU9714081.1 hypothetical protein [Evansella tamaricis]
MPSILWTIAWILVAARCGVRFIHLLNSGSKDLLEILFNMSVVIIALGFLI